MRPVRLAPSVPLLQRSRQRALGLGGELRLVAADEIGADRQDDDGGYTDGDHQRPGEVLDLVSEHIGCETEHRR